MRVTPWGGNHMKTLKPVIGLALAVAALSQAPAATAQSYEGETIEIVYNTGPGGAVGLTAQLVAQHLGKHVEGNPEVVAVSMPGGALLRGIQYVNTAKPDGNTVGWLAWGGSTRVLDPEPLRVKFHEMGILGGLATQWVTHVRTDAGDGLDSGADFAGLDAVTHGGISPNVSTDLRMAASLDLLGIEMDYVGGHKGGADVLAALRRGEVQTRNGTTSNYLTTVVPDLVESGEVTGVFYWGQPTQDGEMAVPALDPLPTFHDYYVAQRGEAPSGPAYDFLRYMTRTSDGMAWLFATPPNVSEDRQRQLSDAFDALFEDPAFVEGATRILAAAPEPVSREAAIGIVNEVRDVSPEIIETMKHYIAALTR